MELEPIALLLSDEHIMTHQHKLYAADFAFLNSSGNYDFNVQCEMLKDIGYDAIQHSVWDCSPPHAASYLSEVQQRHQLEIIGLYVIVDLNLGLMHPRNTGTLAVLEELDGCKAVNMPVRSPGNDERATLQWFERALEIADRRGIDLLLYPHHGFWMDHYSVAVDLCEKLDHPRLGIAYGSHPWFCMSKGGSPLAALKAVLPHLRMLNMAGSRLSPLGFNQIATIEPLDSGELDTLAFLGTAKSLGYEGPIGYMGFMEGGNPYIKLKRSLAALHEMLDVIERHPHWVRHITEPTPSSR